MKYNCLLCCEVCRREGKENWKKVGSKEGYDLLYNFFVTLLMDESKQATDFNLIKICESRTMIRRTF